jgi:subtilisin family serine protease
MAGTMEDTVICVASTDENRKLSSFSNFNDELVSIACPGSNIMSTDLGGGYTLMSGTSMATPMCAGTFTLAASFNPAAELDVIRKKMMETVDQPSGLNGRVINGGQANAFKLLKAVGSGDGTKNVLVKHVKHHLSDLKVPKDVHAIVAKSKTLSQKLMGQD